MFPSQGREACAAFASTLTVTSPSVASMSNSAAVLTAHSAARARTASASKPSSTAFAVPGIMLPLRPELRLFTRGSAPLSAYSAENLGPYMPFSMFMTGKFASGEKVMGAAFSRA